MGMKPKPTWIETDVDKRWEQGIEHHPESVKLMNEMQAVDKLNGWAGAGILKCGGDGDPGEALMYYLDVVFERRDAKKS